MMVVYLLILLFVSSVCRGLQGELFVRVSVKILTMVKNDLFAAIIRKYTSFFDKNKTGELISALTSDCEVIQNCFQMNIDMTFSAVYVITFSLIIMLMLSPTLTGVVFLTLSPSLLVALFFSKCMRYFGKIIQERKKVLTNTA